MTIQTLASQLAKMEGKKHQASIGDIRELLRMIAGLEAAHRLVQMKKDQSKGVDDPSPNGPLEAIHQRAAAMADDSIEKEIKKAAKKAKK